MRTCFNFRTIRDEHIEKAVGKFRISAGFSADGIANQFVKIGFPVIAESLCDILIFLWRQEDSLMLGKLPARPSPHP